METPDRSIATQPPSCLDFDGTQRLHEETAIQKLTTRAEAGFTFYGPSDHSHFTALHATSSGLEIDASDPTLRSAFPLQNLEDDIRVFPQKLCLPSPAGEKPALATYDALPPASTDSQASTNSSSSTLPEGHRISSRRSATKLLLRLAANLQERLEALENGTWQQQGECWNDLDQYPVGSVLHLCQEFIDLGTALRASCCNDHFLGCQQGFRPSGYPVHFPEARSPAAGQNTTTSTEPAFHSDTSVTLILLSCYATLTAIGITVLGHFYQHLNTTTYRDDTAAVAGCNFYPAPTTRLGELSPSGESYTRIHMALNLLLDSLEKAKGAVAPVHTASQVPSNMPSPDVTSSIEARMTRDRMTAPLYRSLIESIIDVQNTFTELEEKAAELKKLLRRKMGL